MNWTGGRLKRHSKANANPLLKSQKQYFATARQRLQNGHAAEVPSRLSITENRVNSNESVEDARASTASSVRFSSFHRDPVATNVLVHQRANVVDASRRSHNEQIPRSSPSGHPRSKRKIPPLEPELNSLDRIKQKLLQNTDWTGLAIVRPVSINFTSAEEMEGIGRRRKVTKEERRRKHAQAGQQQIHHNLIKPFRNQQSQPSATPAEPTDLSIRIGSNIHQTQTTQPSLAERQTSPATKSTATGSMLLDGYEKARMNELTMNAEIASPPASSPPKIDPAESRGLLPLSEVRELMNFDAVFERSLSIVRQRLPSSAPFGPPRSSNQASEIENAPQLRVTEQHSKPRPADQQIAPSEKSGGYIQLARPKEMATNLHKDHVEGVGPAAQKPYQDVPSSVPDKSRQIGPFGDEAGPLKFTLDYQVALESQLRNSGASPAPKDPQSQQVSTSPVDVLTTNGDDSLQHTDRRHHNIWHSAPRRAVDHTDSLVLPDAPVSLLQRYQIAKDQHQAMLKGNEGLGQLKRPQSGRLGDENDAWMKYVFPKDFGRIQQEFNFDMPPPHKHSSNQSITDSWSYHAPPRSTSGARSIIRNAASSTSAPTAANVMIHDSQWEGLGQTHDQMVASETDFLSRFSPMEGVTNDALQNGSTYNNAARTVRSFVAMPSDRQNGVRSKGQFLQSSRPLVPAKRTASHAFEDDFQPDRLVETTISDVPPALQSLLEVPWKQHICAHNGREDEPNRLPSEESAMGELIQRPEVHLHDFRHREANFPLNYSPASSQKSRRSQLWNVTPSPLSMSPNVRLDLRDDVRTPQKPSTKGSQGLWQVSPALSTKPVTGDRRSKTDNLSEDIFRDLLRSSTPLLGQVRRSTPSSSRYF